MASIDDSGLTDGLPEYSDEALATTLAGVICGSARYIGAFGKWRFYDGCRWRDDRKFAAIRCARSVCHDAAIRVHGDERLPEKARVALATFLQSAQKIYAVEKLTRTDIRIAVDTDCWDLHELLLNTPAGTVDLRTGEMRCHAASDFITKRTRYAPGDTCPEWIKFVLAVCDDDRDLVAFIQRVLGYALTGLTKEHALFFFYGTGANGKSTLLSVVMDVLGDYAVAASMETFVESRGERHPADLAMLQGARLVVAQEVEEGQRFAQSRIKALTGGDPISARFMRQDFFTYMPAFKLVLAGNHRPGLRNVDEAIRRRFHLVPFTKTIPTAQRDKDLPERLKREGSGILQWLIDGALEWQRIGLAPPPVVRSATEEYLCDEDVFAGWLDECCERSPNAFERVAELHRSYTGWARKSGERELGIKRFAQQLQERGVERGKHPKDRSRGFVGLGLKQKGIDGI